MASAFIEHDEEKLLERGEEKVCIASTTAQ